jgi:hypothetical protein
MGDMSSHPDPILEVIRQQDEEIANTEIQFNEFTELAQDAKRRLEDLIIEQSALKQIAYRRGALLAPMPETSDELNAHLWMSMSRVDAIEKVLRESPEPMHLSEIDVALRSHGRPSDSSEAISATLAHIKKTRQTVVSMGQGRWAYLRVGTNAAGERHPVMEELAESTRQRAFGPPALPPERGAVG